MNLLHRFKSDNQRKRCDKQLLQDTGGREMKKAAGFFWMIVCVLALAGCGKSVDMEDVQGITETEIFQAAVEEPAVSIDIDDITVSEDASEQYCAYLEQVTERDFIGEGEIGSADAIVSYDEETGRYSIELSIKTDGKLSNEQIEHYKDFLHKTYAEVTFIVDGELLPEK